MIVNFLLDKLFKVWYKGIYNKKSLEIVNFLLDKLFKMWYKEILYMAISLENISVDQAHELLLKLYRIIFSNIVDIDTPEGAMFALSLIKFATDTLNSCIELGGEHKMLPIFSMTIWHEHINDSNEFFIDKNLCVGKVYNKNRVDILSEEMDNAVAKWGNQVFEGFSEVIKNVTTVEDGVKWKIKSEK